MDKKKASNLECMTIMFKLVGKEMDYFQKGSIIDLTVQGGGQKVDLRTQGIFNSNSSKEAMLFKCIHNVGMMMSFHDNLMLNLSVPSAYQSRNLNPSKCYSLKIHVMTEDIKILSRSGFGIIGYNETDMCKVIGESSQGFYSLFERMRNDFIDRNNTDDADLLNRLLRFMGAGKHLKGIVEVQRSFINENFDLYSKYLFD